MPSFSIPMDKRRRTYVRLIGAIRHALNQALTEENAKRGLTQADMARLLGRDKSFISRKLNGTSNMTLETLADLAYALDRPVRVELPERQAAKGETATVSFKAVCRETGNGNVIPFPANQPQNADRGATETRPSSSVCGTIIAARGKPW